MKYTLKTAVTVLCILLASGSLSGQNGQEKKRKNAEKPPNNLGAIRQAIVVDRDMLDVYTRMMRYQTAWRDITNQALGNETTPDDYLTIAIRNVEAGDLKNLSNYLKTIKQPSNDVLAVDREKRCATGGGDCELAYDVRWAKEGAKYGLKFNMPNTGNVDHYLTYDVTVEYKGKSLTHGGVIVHYRNKNAVFMICDGIIPQIDDLILDKLPLMVEKRRMSRVFNDTPTKTKVKELPPAKVWSKLPEDEGIIGWLTGDDMEFDKEYLWNDYAGITMLSITTPGECQEYDNMCYIVNKPLCTMCTPTGNVCDGNGNCSDKNSIVPLISNRMSEVAIDSNFKFTCTQLGYPDYCSPSKIYIITEINTYCSNLDITGLNLTEINSQVATNCPGGPYPMVSNTLNCTVNGYPNTFSNCSDGYIYCIPNNIIPQNGCYLEYTQQYSLRYPSLINSRTIRYDFNKCTPSNIGAGTFSRY